MEKPVNIPTEVKLPSLEALIAEVAKDPPKWQDYGTRSLLIAWDGEILEDVRQGGAHWYFNGKAYIDRESAKKACERKRNVR
jgi:hypothetical protein